MLHKDFGSSIGERQATAAIFAALSDETRLSLVGKLCFGQPLSIVHLTEGSELTRQAITKHLRVLENVGLVHSVRRGRESLFELDPHPIKEIKGYLDLVSEQWDQALSRLKSFVEDPAPSELTHRKQHPGRERPLQLGEDMTKRDYTCSIQAPVSAHDAYDKIARVSEWWAKNFEGSARKLGDTFTVRFGETFVDFKISEAVPDRKIVWQVANCHLPWIQDKTEWNGTSVAWDILPSNGATTVTITHRGLVPGVECYSDCEEGWNGHVQKSLFQFLNGGQGMPE